MYMLGFDASPQPPSASLSQAEQYARDTYPRGQLRRAAVKGDKATGSLARQQDEMSIGDVRAAVRKVRNLLVLACQAYRIHQELVPR